MGTKEERLEASKIEMNFRRPSSQVPTCGTSDPGVMQMMMLPAAAFGDIMMTHVMNPIMDMFTGTRHKGSTERKEETERWSKEQLARVSASEEQAAKKQKRLVAFSWPGGQQ